MPKTILAKIQHEVLEDSYLSYWNGTMDTIVEKRLKLYINTQTKLSKSITDLYEKLGVEGLEPVRSKGVVPKGYSSYNFDGDS